MLSPADIETDPQAYARRRDQVRAQMLPIRRERRLRLGDMLVVEFESAQTLAYQVQEMVYTERLRDPGEIAHEIEIYSRLLPSSHDLCATVFIELEDPRTIRDELARLSGIQHALSLQISAPDGAVRRVPGREIRGLEEDPDLPSATVSVHMVGFHFDDCDRDAFRDPRVPVELVVDHPQYADAVPLTGSTRTALLADLAL